jgi:hypothetical protein
MEKVYLGDSVYAAVEDGMVRLTTENGFGPTNTIYLEPEVVVALLEYLSTALQEYLARLRDGA